jgi:hypothetical protein
MVPRVGRISSFYMFSNSFFTNHTLIWCWIISEEMWLICLQIVDIIKLWLVLLLNTESFTEKRWWKNRLS